jgi:hypothetical protein
VNAKQASSAQKLRWYYQRLQKMSPAEVGWRTSDFARKWTWSSQQVHPSGSHAPSANALIARTGKLLGWHPSQPEPLPARHFANVLPPGFPEEVSETGREAVVRGAETLMEGRWHLLGRERTDMTAPKWFYDPVTDRTAPGAAYCFRVDHRDEAVTGNIKQVWELSRHHHVTVLAAAYALTGEQRYAERAASHLRSWWQQNPFLSGVNWSSGIEAGIRLISWVWARRLLASWPGAPLLFEENEHALSQIWWHQRYLEGFRSRGSSANNHVVAEAAGQLVGALAFPWFTRSERWALGAAQLLEAELANNTFPSGANREMAFEYHGLVAELGLVAAAEADRAGWPLSDRTWEILTKMLDVLAATVDIRLGAPRYGDGDDGRALVLAPGPNRWESLLSTGRALVGAPDWWPQTTPDMASACVAAIAGKHPGPDRAPKRPSHFPDAGLSLLRTPPGEVPEIWCRCDSGPHGFLSIGAHAHADALSIEVRHDGTELLADPGTYCYHGEGKWRAYFRSTLAHNTLEIGGVDQSVPGGPFLWSLHAGTRLLDADLSDQGEGMSWVAEHDGYTRLVPPAVHRRAVCLNSAKGTLLVQDLVLTEGAHPFRLAFHFGPLVEVDLDGNRAQLSWPASTGTATTALMELPAAASWRLARGELDPPLGWYSSGFGHKVPAYCLVGTGRCAGEKTELTTELHVGPR